jgi:hypothetical protein
MKVISAQPGWRIVSVTTQTQTSTVADFTVRDVIAWRDDGVGHLLPVTVSSGNAYIYCFAAISPSGQIIDWLDREHGSVDEYVACAERELLASNAEELAEKRATSAAARRTAA